MITTTGDELLARLRSDPLDDDTRTVYADWLEEQGLGSRAAFLRARDLATRRAIAIANPDDAAWRSVVTRQPLARCASLFKQGCAIPWERHAVTDDDQQRVCGTCRRAVFYCAELGTLEQLARTAKRCIVLDLALDEDAAKDLYDATAYADW